MKKIINNFIPLGGAHCITNSLKQIFTYYGYPISEAMMFGLASGLSFLYINQSVSPMVNGRIKVFEFEEKLAKRLNIKINCKSSKNYNVVFDKAIEMIDQNEPILIYVDMPYLNYLNMNENSHFGGHAVVLFGYDDFSKMFYVSDRDNHDYSIRTPSGKISDDYHLVSYAEIEKARLSNFRPFPASNKYLTFDFTDFTQIHQQVLYDAIKETCDIMLNPPAQLLGIKGIMKFSKEIKKWKNFDYKKLILACQTNYFQISKDGGTGGGIFRKLYGEFLIEASDILANHTLYDLGNQFILLSNQWDEIADMLWKISLTCDTTLLNNVSELIAKNYTIEKVLYNQLLSLVNCDKQKES